MDTNVIPREIKGREIFNAPEGIYICQNYRGGFVVTTKRNCETLAILGEEWFFGPIPTPK